MKHFMEFASWLWSIGEEPDSYPLYTDEHIHLCDLRAEFTRLDRMFARDLRSVAHTHCEDISF